MTPPVAAVRPPRPGEDPWRYYAALRARGPVVRSAETGMVQVVRYGAAVEALTRPEISGAHPFRATRRVFGPNLLDLEGPRHRALRRVAAPEFRTRAVTGYAAGLVRPVVERAVAPLVDRGPVDAVASFAAVVPVRVVAGVLGIPDGRAAEFYAGLAPVIRYLDRPEGNLLAALAARDRLDARLAALVRAHRVDVGLLGRLLHDPGHGLDEHGLVRLVLLLVAAGTETTVRGLANLLAVLLAVPGRLAALRADRSLIGPAVDETLRFEPPLHSTLRHATEDTVLGGVAVPAGAALQVLLASANRDGRVFAGPDAWTPGRAGPRALTFGFGVHTCLGRTLARLELVTALEVLLDRTSDVRAAGPPGPRAGTAFQGPSALPIDCRS
ncbi:Cytochrome P450 107B1 [Actinomadura rubteroloni]|uniref:Cytochrome P450 107B1 n=1 Tax=Actinomadura rubteroloni TaxID=1926885 RepID=A0A2P4UJZ5_9ACTN|nr:cytochrome P450 [Actinomadura rubteroloni]POM25373.1 Cytochrome P450 107B1 [Actinomadura rubteroloni]